MPVGPQRRIETSKQAKAAFKARGCSTTSATQRRQIERGAELLQRAERIKAQEERRKEWSKRKETEQKSDAPALGSQRKLDRFGYASSQFHLGRFFNAKGHEQHKPDATTGSFDLSAILTVSSQFARELSLSPLSPTKPAENTPGPNKAKDTFLSFSSEDGLFDDQTLLELDRVVDTQMPHDRPGTMLPPALPLPKVSPETKNDLTLYGITAADLESLAGYDLQLTQYEG